MRNTFDLQRYPEQHRQEAQDDKWHPRPVYVSPAKIIHKPSAQRWPAQRKNPGRNVKQPNPPAAFNWGKHIAQEHSYVQDMWLRISKPDFLVYLDVSYPLTIQRRKLDWTEDEYLEEIHRLRHARQHADFYLNTDSLTAQEVLFEVITFLEITGNR